MNGNYQTILRQIMANSSTRRIIIAVSSNRGGFCELLLDPREKLTTSDVGDGRGGFGVVVGVGDGRGDGGLSTVSITVAAVTEVRSD